MPRAVEFIKTADLLSLKFGFDDISDFAIADSTMASRRSRRAS